ncbi:n-alkane-inducible cytochrome P450 [Bisporella sp. PMI_857]|nr:n-alkane-inducible cytochrome P450 [Bisporella sp. PMI_857]
MVLLVPEASSLSLVVVGVVTGLVALRRVIRAVSAWNFSRQNGCSSPPIRTNWSFGMFNLLEMVAAARENRFLELIRGWHLQYGKTYQTTIGGRTVIMTIEPKNVQAVLAVKFADFDLGHYRNKAVSPLLGRGIFATDGSAWEHSRALVRPNFVRNQIADMEIYESHVAKLIQHLPRDGSIVDMQELFFRMTLDSATEFLFGESVNSLNDTHTSSSNFAENFNISQDGLALRARMGPLALFHFGRRFSTATAEARRYVGQFVEKAVQFRKSIDSKTLSDKEHQYVFLHELSKRTLDHTELTDQLLNILLAGRDTTASLLSITFFQLARHPNIWNKLRQEVLNLDGRKPSFEDLKSMKYLSWVLNETLRLYPVVPFNVRMANKDTCLPLGGGADGKAPIFVPKGQEVMYSVYSMHRGPEIYGPDATEYRPERWEALKPGWAYIPFNGGPRICIGQQFALTEAGYAIVRIMQQFKEIESRDAEPFQELLTLTMASKNGAKVALTPTLREEKPL